MGFVMLAQYGGYGGGIVVILALIVLAALVVAVGGIAVIAWLRGNQRGPLLRPMLLWCLGVLGALCAVFGLGCLYMVGPVSGGRDFDSIDLWVVAGVVVAVLGLLPGAIIEWKKQGWGVVWIVLLAAGFGAALTQLDVPPYAYAFTLYGMAGGVLLPLWGAAAAIWCTTPRPKPLRYSTQ